MDQDSIHGILALTIPITAIVLGIGIGALSLWLDYRRKTALFELHHRERMAAIEKGIEVPPLPPELFTNPRRRSRDPLKSGLVWTLIGVAVCIAWFMQDKDSWAWGLIPLAIGLANLIYVFIRRRTGTAVDEAQS
jgi:multisubunit Na+/H+ antiporter MnhC subunit